jgi:phosphohistidine phosphatase
MPVILYVMRHGPAEANSASGRDWDRRLSPEGSRVVEAVADELVRVCAGHVPRVIASPAVRAHETAAIVAARLGTSEPELADELGPDEGPALALAARVVSEGIDTILVGHQPSIEALARALLDRADTLPPFRTALVVGMAMNPASRTGRRTHLIDPSSLIP